MADNKNNLEDFFKNRINDFNGSNNGWDLPDESVWKNAKTHFPIHPQNKTWDWKLEALILLVFAMLGAVSYIYFLKNDLLKKTTKLELANIEAENNNNTIASFEKEIRLTKSALNSEKNDTQNTISSLAQQQQNSTKTIFNQKKIIQILQMENQKLKKELISIQATSAAKKESNSSSKENLELNFLTKKTKETLGNTIPVPPSFLEIKNDFSIQKIDLKSEFKIIFPSQKKQRNKFEIGLSYSSMNFEIPLVYDFEKLEKEDFGEKDWSFSLDTKGGQFHLGYEIQPYFWITTGLRITTSGVEKIFSDKLIYDKSSEYLDNNGKTINEFDITTQSSFGEGGSTINFEIPSGTNIDDGDFLETKWNYSQQYQFTQIPIGVNYFVGKNKLQGFFEGGFGWNKVSFSEDFVEAQLSFNNESLPIKEKTKSKKNEINSQFINGFVGAGLDYQLTSNWNIRTSFTLEKNFIQKKEILKSNSLSKVFDFGLNYRF